MIDKFSVNRNSEIEKLVLKGFFGEEKLEKEAEKCHYLDFFEGHDRNEAISYQGRVKLQAT